MNNRLNTNTPSEIEILRAKLRQHEIEKLERQAKQAKAVESKKRLLYSHASSKAGMIEALLINRPKIGVTYADYVAACQAAGTSAEKSRFTNHINFLRQKGFAVENVNGAGELARYIYRP